MSTKRGRSLADVIGTMDEDEAVTVQSNSRSAEIAEPTGAGEEGVPIVPLNVLITPDDRRRLKQLSLDTGLSLQKLGHQAWNLLLAQRGLEPLTPVAANRPMSKARRS